MDTQEQEQEYRASDVIGRLKSYVHKNLGGDLSLVKLAEVFFFNPTYLSRLFKQIEGNNLSAYINEQKINRAKKLLVNPNMRISDIGLEVGYELSANFTRFFKKHTHTTPQEYRDVISGQQMNDK